MIKGIIILRFGGLGFFSCVCFGIFYVHFTLSIKEQKDKFTVFYRNRASQITFESTQKR